MTPERAAAGDRPRFSFLNGGCDLPIADLYCFYYTGPVNHLSSVHSVTFQKMPTPWWPMIVLGSMPFRAEVVT